MSSGPPPSRAMPSVPAMGPGVMEFTRTPAPPHSMASTRVSMSTPALAAQTWLWKGAGAKACGAEGFRCERPEEVRSAIQAALNSPGPAIVEAVVDAEEKPSKPDELKA